LKEGKAKPPPVPIEWVEAEGVFMPLNFEPHTWSEEDNLIYEWQKTACEHRNMDYASVSIANWFMYRKFKQAPEYTGWNFFPQLQAELPETNDGSTSTLAVQKCMAELEVFRQIAKFKAVYLVDSENGEEAYSYIAPFKGVMVMDMTDMTNRCDYGLDVDGFFVYSHPKDADLFRSTRFEQRIRNINGQKEVEYFDAQTEQRFMTSVSLSVHDSPTSSYIPKLLHVETREVGAEYFDYILKPLITIFEASIETGNPVYWS
jgi:hypothetical protein